jgi:uncharacterized membrane protein YdjX (TVP38/TMEM64 family)
VLRNKSIWVLLSWFTAAIAGLILLKATGILEAVEIDEVGEWLRDLGAFGGYVFGSFWGTIYDVIGAGAGALLSFIIARKWGSSGVRRLIKGKKLQSFDDKAEKSGILVVLYMRLMPFFPFDGVSYGAGLSKIRFWDYTWATFIGIIPGAIVYNVFGASLNAIGSAQFFGAVLLYTVFALVLLWVTRRKRKK